MIVSLLWYNNMTNLMSCLMKESVVDLIISWIVFTSAKNGGGQRMQVSDCATLCIRRYVFELIIVTHRGVKRHTV